MRTQPLPVVLGFILVLVIAYVVAMWAITFHPAFDRNRLGTELCGDADGPACPTGEGRTMAPPAQ